MSELERLRRENAELRARLAAIEGSRDDAAFLASLLEVVPAFIIRADADLRVSYINRFSPGYTPESVLGSSLLDYVSPEFRDAAQQAFERALVGGMAQFRSLVHRPDGDAYFQSYVAPLPEPDGSTGIVVMAFDVTADELRERSLEASERKLRIAIDATGVGLWSFDVQAGAVTWNERMHEITGYPTPLTTAGWLEELVHPDDRAAVEEVMARAHRGEMQSLPHRIVRPDGEVRWVVSHGKAVTDGDGVVTHMYGGLLDITRQKELEDQIRHAQKLEAIGSLTAGVAHNFNNLLMAILPTLDMLRPVVPSSHADLLTDAVHAAERGAELVRELMTFAGQQRRTTRVTEHPETFVGHAVAICRRTFDASVALDVRIEDGLPHVSCDPGAIEHALMNVLLNARDALGGRPGRIEVAARRVPAAERQAAGLAPGAWLCVEVRDDGPGIPPPVRERIFEPFFTTKGPQGTGLGLSTVYAVFKEHGGHVDFDSSEEGTTFRLYLPLTAEAPQASASAGSGALVLLIDDEPAVRRVVGKMLEVSGYSVLEAGGGDEALQLVTDREPAVVLLDRSMPGQSGRALLPELRRRLPRAKILYFTGQHIPPAERAEVDGVVQKPARMAALAEAIDRALA